VITSSVSTTVQNLIQIGCNLGNCENGRSETKKKRFIIYGPYSMAAHKLVPDSSLSSFIGVRLRIVEFHYHRDILSCVKFSGVSLRYLPSQAVSHFHCIVGRNFEEDAKSDSEGLVGSEERGPPWKGSSPPSPDKK